MILPNSLLDSPIWFSLSKPAKDVYVAIRRMRYKRNSRGKKICESWNLIPFGYSDRLGKMQKKTFVKAIEELRVVKLVKLESPGTFPNKKAEYSLPMFRR